MPNIPTTPDKPSDTAEVGTAREATRREREDLARIARLRARVARTSVAQREAELLAGVEEQLSAVYKFDAPLWSEITREAEHAVTAAHEKLAARCRELGIPEEFRPNLHLGWASRGENTVTARRAELRKKAQSRIAATGKAAKAAIERAEAEVLTELLASGLTTDAARGFLAAMPTAQTLMPPVALVELESRSA
jgi:hypothetical protein